METFEAQQQRRSTHKQTTLKPINATVLDGLSPIGRKQYPVGAFIRDYFPNALLVLANHSMLSNEQHNPGEPMRWAKEKSVGEGDQIIRHFMEGDNVSMAWRALELLERELIK
tara:strand:- start:879 stop:1217 length:339 start_codon:yes stop_codon:yes gene_type:complete